MAGEDAVPECWTVADPVENDGRSRDEVESLAAPAVKTASTEGSNSGSDDSSPAAPRKMAATSSAGSLRMELYSEAKAQWTSQRHRHISCQHDKDSVVLFRACCEHLGPHATEKGSFRGSTCYEKDQTRMMWFDTSFFVSMRKSAWGTLPGREVVLAIWVRRKFLEDCLGTAVCSNTFGSSGEGTSTHNGGAANAARASSRPTSLPHLSGSPPPRSRFESLSPVSPRDASREEAPSPAASESARRRLADGRRELDADDDNGDDAREKLAAGLENRGRAVTMDSSLHRGRSSAAGDAPSGRRATRSRSRARSQSLTRSSHGRMTDGVRLHWEPDRLPSGEKHRTRRVVQLGLKGKWLEELGSGDAVLKIERLDGVVAEQRAALTSDAPQMLMVPVSRPMDLSHFEDSQLAALHLVSERARPKLRILCLHGYLQNRQIFDQRTRQFCRKLRPTAELVYVDAPHMLGSEQVPPLPAAAWEAAAAAAAAAAAEAVARVAISGEGGAPGLDPEAASATVAAAATETMANSEEQEEVPSKADAGEASECALELKQGSRANARTWWRCDAEERKKAKAVPGMTGRCEWQGLEKSLSFLRQVWDEQGPFDGVLGFSQGAAMASVFYHCSFSNARERMTAARGAPADEHLGEAFRVPRLPPPKFMVFISGSYQPHPTQIPSYPLDQEDSQEELPTLHVWSVYDRFVSASQSQRLASMYARANVFIHRGSHCVPQTKDIMPNFIRFLEGFR